MTANNDGWIDWVGTKEKPYPETLETKVDVKFRDGTCTVHHQTVSVRWWYSEIIDANNWYNSGDDSDIVAYRVVN
jgi:hypothetical protein